MNKRRLIGIIPAAALLLLAACTQDEPGGQGNELPYGEYPLQIGGVTLDVESSAEPWSAKAPQTRVTENNTDGKSSVWEWDGSEQIGVQLGDGDAAFYTLDVTKKVLPSGQQLYWTSTDPTYITAWYPVDETVDLSDQTERLAYVLQATQDPVSYDEQPVTLNFNHKLAKVRVLLDGSQAEDVTNVEVYNYTQCRHILGTIVTSDTEKGWIQMKKQEYADGTVCYEANVIPSEVIDHVKVNGIETTLTTSLTPVVATLNTIDLTVGEKITDIKDNTTINDNGYYRVSGIFNHQITITGGSPTIYLENASISVSSGPAINVTSGTPTIHVTGENTIETSESLSNRFAGIYVAQGSSVTIEGRGTSDVLRVTGGTDGAAIGGYSPALNSHNPCGDITIHNVTLYAYASSAYLNNLPIGIGSTGTASCGKIEITDAIVHARGV